MYEIKHDGTVKEEFTTIITTNFKIHGTINNIVGNNSNPIKENFATLENNSYRPEEPRKYCSNFKVMYSEPQTDADGKFLSPLVIALTFSKALSFNGIKLYCKNVMTSFSISAYNGSSSVHDYLNLVANEEDHLVDHTFNNVDKIVITINSLDVSNRSFRLYSINLGKIRVFGENDLVNIKMERNISLSSREAPFSTIEFTIKDGIFDYLFLEDEPIMLVENGCEKYTFYVSESNETIVKCMSSLSNVNQKTSGKMYEQATPILAVVNDIFSKMPLNFCNVAETIKNKKVIGYIPPCSLREALIYISASVGAVLDDSDGTIWIKSPQTDISGIFTNQNTISKSEKTEKKISSVTLVNHNYSKSNETIELYNWFMAKNENRTINFSQPAHDLKAYKLLSDGETKQALSSSQIRFVEADSNYCIIKNISVSDKVIIEGKKYTENKDELIKSESNMKNDGNSKIVAIENATLLSTTPIVELDRFYNHYTSNKLFTCQVLSNDVLIGSKIKVLNHVGFVQKVTTSFNGITELEVR